MRQDMHADAFRAKVERLWLQTPQLSSQDIGNILGVTKNVVIGLASRMKLPRRPSPIKRNDGKPWAPPPPPKQQGARAVVVAREASERVVALRVVEKPAPPPRVVLPPVFGLHRTCQWLTGADGAAGTRHLPFCDAATVRGSPYCAAHTRRAFGGGMANAEAA